MVSKKNNVKENSFAKKFTLFFGIFLILLIVVLLSMGWGSFSIKNPEKSISLISYDKYVSTNDSCFNILIESKNNSKSIENLFVTVNDLVSSSKTIEFLDKYEEKICINNSFFNQKQNLVEINFSERKIFFNIEKIDQMPIISSNLELISFKKINDYEGEINFSIKNNFQTKEPVFIYNNGSLIRRAFYEDGNIVEKISIVQGENNISMSFFENDSKISLTNNIPSKSNYLIGIFILSLALFIFLTFVFSKITFLENITYSILSLLTLMIIVFFILNYTNLLNAFNFIFVIVLSLFGLVFLFWKNFSLPKFDLKLPTTFQFYFVLLIIGIFLFNIITPSYVSFWTSFYERQSRDIFELNSVPLLDRYTNFGEKPFGYLSGYFFVNSGISYLIGEYSKVTFGLVLLFSTLSFFLSAYLFSKSFFKNENKAIIFVMLFSLAGFILGDLFFNSRHLISTALMFLGLYFFLNNKKYSFLPISLAIFVQPPIILTLILVSFVVIEKKLKDKILFWLKSFGFGLIFFIPTLYLYGFPTQANPTVWGYLFGMPWYGVAVDLLAQLVFFFLILLPLNNFNLNLDKYSKKVFFFLIILILVQLFVSYRVNIATAIIFSIISIYLFSSKLLEKKEFRLILFLLFIGGLAFSSIVLLNYAVPDYAISSANQLSLVSSSEDKVMNEPALGHYVAFFSKRKIASDLAVEYQSDNYINDSYEFFFNKDKNVLVKYDIDYVFNKPNYIETMPVGSPFLNEKLNFFEIDKIYDNGYFYIHYFDK